MKILASHTLTSIPGIGARMQRCHSAKLIARAKDKTSRICFNSQICLQYTVTSKYTYYASIMCTVIQIILNIIVYPVKKGSTSHI